MTRPVPQSEEYKQEKRGLEEFCITLAKEYDLTPNRTTNIHWNEPYRDKIENRHRVILSMKPPTEREIWFRDKDSRLIAILEIIPHFDRSKGQLTQISRLNLKMLEYTNKYEEFARQFAQKYDLDTTKIQIGRIKEETLNKSEN